MYLYRGDNRKPEVIKRDGFSGRSRYLGGGNKILEKIQKDIKDKGQGTLPGLLSILRGHTPLEACAAARHMAGASYGDYIYYFKITPVYAFEFTKDGTGNAITAADFDNVDCLIMNTQQSLLATTVALHHSAKTAPTKEVTFYTLVAPGNMLWYTKRPGWGEKPAWKSMANIIPAPPEIQSVSADKFKALRAKFGN